MQISLTPDQRLQLSSESHSITIPATVVGLRFIMQMLQGQAMGQTKLGEMGAPTQFEIDKAVKDWTEKIFKTPLIDCEVDL